MRVVTFLFILLIVASVSATVHPIRALSCSSDAGCEWMRVNGTWSMPNCFPQCIARKCYVTCTQTVGGKPGASLNSLNATAAQQLLGLKSSIQKISAAAPLMGIAVVLLTMLA